MKKFKFQLDGLLTLRDWEEQKAKQKLGEVTGRIAQLKNDIESIGNQKTALFASWSEDNQKSFSPMQRIALEAQVALFGTQTKDLQKNIQEAEQQRLKAIQELKEVARSKQVVENLKEKRMEEFRVEFYRQESREIEDIFNSRHKGVHS